MSRILVLGAFGFYGSKVAQALRGRGHEVGCGTRTLRGREAEVRVDLDAPDSFVALREFDVVVNCSDSVNAQPDAAIRWVLAHGGVWLEMGAHADTLARLLAIEAGPECAGTVVLGVGVFPGLSTALARSVAAQVPGCQRVELGVRLSPLSGAGPANCALMAESLFAPASRYVDGELVEARTAMGEAVTLTFEAQQVVANNFALPDTLLIHRCTQVPNVAAYFAIVPGVLRYNFAVLAWMCRLLRFARRPLVWLLTWQMIALRAWLLRNVESRVQLVAIAERGTPREQQLELSFADGQQATADGTVAAVEAWLARDPSLGPFGVFGVAELFSFHELLVHMH